MRTRVVALALSVLLVAGLAPSIARADTVTERSVTVASFDGAGIEVYVQHPPGFDPDAEYPVVFHGHGWGGSAPRGGLQRRYAEAGYLAVGWSVRGFGSSGGQVGVNGPDEAQDIVALIDWVTSEYNVSNHDGAPGKYDIGFVGDSYGGGSAYLAARFDERVKAIAPGMPWSRLDHSLYPGGSPKLGWDLLLFGAGLPASGFGYSEMLYRWFVSLATTVGVDQTLEDLRWRSVAEHLDDLNANGAAVLINQGISDTLFTGSEATHIWDRLEVPKKLYQTNIGHSNHSQALGQGAPRNESRVRDDLTLAFFDHFLKGADNGIVYLDGATGCLAGDPDNGLLAGGDAPVLVNHLREPYDERRLGRQEDWNGAAVEPLELHLAAAPGGIGTLGDEADGITVLANTVVQAGLTTGETFNVVLADVPLPSLAPVSVPGTEAVFRSAPLDAPLTISGDPTLAVDVTPVALGLRGTPQGLMQLTTKLYQVSSSGQRELLSRGVVHAGDLTPAQTTRIEIPLNALAHELPAGHAVELEIGTSDLAYVAPSYSASAAVLELAGEQPAVLTLPVRTAERTEWTAPEACPTDGEPEEPGDGGPGGPGDGGPGDGDPGDGDDPDGPGKGKDKGKGKGTGGGRDHAPGQQGRPVASVTDLGPLVLAAGLALAALGLRTRTRAGRR